ncbi:hypothetical protein [Azospirillum doebereinerae]
MGQRDGRRGNTQHVVSHLLAQPLSAGPLIRFRCNTTPLVLIQTTSGAIGAIMAISRTGVAFVKRPSTRAKSVPDGTKPCHGG